MSQPGALHPFGNRIGDVVFRDAFLSGAQAVVRSHPQRVRCLRDFVDLEQFGLKIPRNPDTDIPMIVVFVCHWSVVMRFRQLGNQHLFGEIAISRNCIQINNDVICVRVTIMGARLSRKMIDGKTIGRRASGFMGAGLADLRDREQITRRYFDTENNV